MEISVTEAKTRLTELVRLALQGDEVVLTRHGQAVARLTPITKRLNAEAKLKMIEEIQQSAAGKDTGLTSAARSQDFLYDDEGLPA